MANQNTRRINTLVAISNFVLRELRIHFAECGERFLRWDLTGAFNGARLACTKQTFTCLFFNPYDLRAKRFSTFVYPFDDMLIALKQLEGELDDRTLTRLVWRAYHNAQIKVAEIDECAEMVSYIYWTVMFEDRQGTSQEQSVDIRKAIVDAMKTEVSQSELINDAFGDGRYRLDMEFNLETPCTQDELITRLASFLPKIHRPLIKTGYAIVNRDGSACQEPRIKWGQITARHF